MHPSFYTMLQQCFSLSLCPIICRDLPIPQVVRCRPFNKKEKDQGCLSIIDINVEGRSVQINKPSEENAAKSYTFDGAYDEMTQQKIFYEDCCFSLVENVLEGFNGTIFAYGQTGCGKSFTMQGPNGADANGRGVTPNAFVHIFDAVKASTDVQYLIHCSYLEIYQEVIKDLLVDVKAAKASNAAPVKCDVKEDANKGVFVSNLTKRTAKTEEELQRALDDGFALRTVAATQMNAESSRSHSIFTIVVEMSQVDPDTKKEMIKVGKLNLVDLAGSERQKKTGASGAQLKEGAKINLSLSVLGNVISALADAKPGKHVPYRDSKLTRLLQDSLGGNTKTLMVAAISPADYNWEETSSTLRYANRAKNIQNKATINEDPKDTMMRELREQVDMLKKMLENQGPGGAPMSMNADGGAAGGGTVEVIREVVRDSADTEALRAEKEQMAAAFEEERRKHEELMAKMLDLQTQFTGNNTGNLSEQMAAAIGTAPDGSPVKAQSQEQTEEQKEALDRLKERRKKARSRRDNKKQREIELAVLAAAAAEEEMEELKMQQGAATQEAGEEIREEARKKLIKLKRKYEKKLQAAEKEVDDIIEEASYQRGQLLESLRESDKDSRLYEAICLSVMSEREMKKIMDKCRYEEEEEYWIVPFQKRESIDQPNFLKQEMSAPASREMSPRGSAGNMYGGGGNNNNISNNNNNQIFGGGGGNSVMSSLDSMTSNNLGGGNALQPVRQSGGNGLPGLSAGASHQSSRRGSKDGKDLPTLKGASAGMAGADEYGEVSFQGGSDYIDTNASGMDMSKCGVLPGVIGHEPTSLPANLRGGGGGGGGGSGGDEYDYYCGDGSAPATGAGSLLQVKEPKKQYTAEEKELRAKKRAKKKAKAEKMKAMQEQQNQVYSDEAGAGESAGITHEWGWANDGGDAQQAYEQDGDGDSEPAYSDDEDFTEDKAHPPTDSKKSKNTKAPNRKKGGGLPAL